MKALKLIILAFSLFVINNAVGQIYNMSNSMDTTCTGTFYDNGGLGLYSNGVTYTQTFCPNAAGVVTSVNFTTFRLSPGHTLTIRDGGATGVIIGVYSNASLNGITIKASSPSGCLTFIFNSTSAGAVANNGWTANLSCVYACQPFSSIADSTSPTADTNNEIKLCIGATLNMNGNASYPLSGTYYNQNNSTSNFTWKTGDGFTIPGRNAAHTFNTPGVFDVSLIVTDTIGCERIDKGPRIIVSTTPNFRNVSYFPNDTICFGDTATIMVPDSGLFSPYTPPMLNAAGVTFLPDGTGTSYRDTIPVSIFSNTATFGVDYLNKVFVNMEHSYLGDLEIRLICPNGQNAILKQYPGGLGTHLGEPVDPFATPVPLNPGVGYTYEFTNKSPIYNTMNNEAGVYQHNYTDVLGNNYVGQDYLPAGTYTPFQVLNTQLNGCPLNGNWIIQVTDNIAVDNGYIFFWGLEFDTLIRPPTTVPTSIVGIRDSSVWTSISSVSGPTNDTSIQTSPGTPGTHQYLYRIFDNFGCVHDTTLEIYVKPKPTSNAGIDFTTCRLDYQLAPVPTTGVTSNSWTYFTPSLSGISTISNPSIANPNTVVNEYTNFFYVLEETVDGCQTYPDTVEITHIQLQNTIDIAVDKDTVCIPELVRFTNNSDMTFYDSVYWDFGDGSVSNSQGSATHTYLTPLCYDLKVTLVNNLGCKVDSVLQNIVCAYPTPIASFNYSPFESIIPETNITFVNTSTGGSIYLWDFAGLGTSTNRDDSYEFPKTEGGQYPVTLTVTNEGGCTDQVTQIVTIKNPLSIWIPNTFSPNEDGLNDNFSVVFNNASVTQYSVMIFNRWGELMFYSEDPAFEWDGTYNGEKAPIGVYTWKISGKEEFATESFTKIGHVTLVR